MELERRLAELRREKNLSQEELAEKLYVSRQTISNWERDKTYPDINSLLLMANYFDVSLGNGLSLEEFLGLFFQLRLEHVIYLIKGK